MRPVVYRLRCGLRTRWRSTVGLTLVVAVVGAIVLAFAAGAQRTASSPDRYTRANDAGYDVTLQQDRGIPRLEELRNLPAVEEIDSATFVFGGLTGPDALDANGKLRPEAMDSAPDAIVFGGDYRALASRLVDGRDADPAVRGEFVATETWLEIWGATVGDRFVFVSYTQEHADKAGFSSDIPDGPVFPAQLVGIIEGEAGDEDPTSRSEPVAIFPYTLLDEPEIGVATSIMAVKLTDGASMDDLQQQVDELDGRAAFILAPAVLVGPSVRTAVEAQSQGLWLLAAVSAIAAVAVLGQLITRQVRLPAAERSRLSALGFIDKQIVAESVGRAAVPIVVGSLLAIVIAVLTSGVFPSGFARRLEPDPGIRIEAVVLIVGAIGLVLALLLWNVLAVGSGDVRPDIVRPSPVIEGIATKSPSATAATGLRLAFIRGQRDSGSVRTSVAGLLMTVVGIVGALTFAASLQRLVTDPTRYGENYDGSFGSGQTTVSDELRSALEAEPDVDGLMLLSEGQARVNDYTLRLIGMEPVKGDVSPRVLAGRLPVSEDEIALGRLAAHALHVGIGDELALEGVDGTRTFRVTGLAVVPSIGSNEGIGQDGLVTYDGLQQIDPEVVANTPIFNVRPGTPRSTIGRIMSENGAADVGESTVPAAIQNLGRVRAIPYLLAALLGTLAVLTVAHVMLTSMNNRRRDIAIVRCLGADRSWITRAVHWQATSFIVLPLLIGTPVGLIVGQVVFRSFADSVGAVNGASRPFLLVAAIVVGLTLLANLAAAVPARRARRLAPATLLQSE
ncbi:MAG: FtsX-like permease family protein [Acidimicrobiales bacterium]